MKVSKATPAAPADNCDRSLAENDGRAKGGRPPGTRPTTATPWLSNCSAAPAMVAPKVTTRGAGDAGGQALEQHQHEQRACTDREGGEVHLAEAGENLGGGAEETVCMERKAEELAHLPGDHGGARRR